MLLFKCPSPVPDGYYMLYLISITSFLFCCTLHSPRNNLRVTEVDLSLLSRCLLLRYYETFNANFSPSGTGSDIWSRWQQCQKSCRKLSEVGDAYKVLQIINLKDGIFSNIKLTAILRTYQIARIFLS